MKVGFRLVNRSEDRLPVVLVGLFPLGKGRPGISIDRVCPQFRSSARSLCI